MSRFRVAAVLFASNLAGCAITPSQEDVTGISTAVLARKLSCEVRDAAYKQMGLYLLDQEDDAAAIRAGNQIRKDMADPSVDDYRRIDFRGIHKDTMSVINKYLDTAVAFDFTLDGIEANNASMRFNPLSTFARGSRSYETGLHFDRSRQNTQTFTNSFSLRELIFVKSPEYCAIASTGANYLYPIAGEIGIFDKLNQFFSLSEFVNLKGPREKTSGPPAMSFNMKFTTKVSADVNPMITLSPVVNVTRTSGSFTFNNERTDTHTLILAFARADSKVTDSEFATALTGQFVPPVADQTQQRARNEIGRSILRTQLNRSSQPIVVYQSLIPFL